MRPNVSRLPLRLAFLLVISALPFARAAEPLVPDDRIKTGRLPNGVTWMYRQHANPPGRMAVMIHVRTGSLNETDAQRGLAHFLEHMAFNGTENFKPGELIPYFESIGMQFGGDVNAFTSFEQTVFFLLLPDTTEAQVDKALMVLSDYAFRNLLLSEEIDKERGVILSELRRGMSPEQRIRDELFPRLFEGTRFAQRMPIGIAEVIEKAPRAEFEAYYRTWYHPERVTVILVGDAEPAPFLPLIEKWFGEYRPPAAARPLERPGFKPFTQERALVVTDPEYATADVDLYSILPARPPTTTVEQYRVELVERLGSWIVERRFSERIKKGAASYRQASADVSDFIHDALLVNASAVGEPQDWEKMLDEVVIEVARAAEHGFLPQELDLATRELIANAERAVRTESTRDAQAVMMGIMRNVNAQEPVLAAAQRLELLRKLLPTIKLEEVSAAFAANFKPGTFAYVLTLPEKEGVTPPAEADVLAAAKAARARKTDPPTWEARPTTLLEEEPQPGKTVASETDQDLDITSAWLGNNVRVHHRFMDYKKDTVFVSITMAGGEIEETAENAGVSAVAALILDQPATGRLKSTDVEDIMTGRNIRVGGGANEDAFTLSISGSPRDLEAGLQLAHALLTDGRLESSAFDNWKEAAHQQYERGSKRPDMVAFDALFRLVSGNDPRRTLLMTPERIDAQSIDKAQAWFDRLRKEAPIEVAVVGELSLTEAMPLIEKYVGSLPSRPRTADHLEKLRALKRGQGPYEKHLTIETITPVDMVIHGFIGADIAAIDDVRALNLAALTLDSRLIKRVREELGLVYSIGAQSMPGQAYQDGGMFLSGAPSREPGQGEKVMSEMAGLFADFAEKGPTAEELDNARKQISVELDKQLKEPQFWFNQLQHLDLHGLKLDNLKNIPAAYQALTADQVRAAFARYYTPQRRFDLLAEPAPVPASAPAEPEEAPAKP